MADIYLAHAPADLDKARRLVEEFDSRGYDVWLDELISEIGPRRESNAHLDVATIAIFAWSDAGWRSGRLRAAAYRALRAPLGDGGLPGLELSEGATERSKYFPIWLSARKPLPVKLRSQDALSLLDLAPQSKELHDVIEAVIGRIGPPRQREARLTRQGVPVTLELAAARWAQIRKSRRPRDFSRYLQDFGEHEPVFSELAAERRGRLLRFWGVWRRLRSLASWFLPPALLIGATTAALVIAAPTLRESGCASIAAQADGAGGEAAPVWATLVKTSLGCGLADAEALETARTERAAALAERAEARREADAARRAAEKARRKAEEALAERARLSDQFASLRDQAKDGADRIVALEQTLRDLQALSDEHVADKAMLEEELSAERERAAAEMATLRSHTLEALQRLHRFYDARIAALPERGHILGAENAEALQACLLDAGATLPDHGADGKLGPETHAALAVALEQAETPDRLLALLECLAR